MFSGAHRFWQLPIVGAHCIYWTIIDSTRAPDSFSLACLPLLVSRDDSILDARANVNFFFSALLAHQLSLGDCPFNHSAIYYAFSPTLPLI